MNVRALWFTDLHTWDKDISTRMDRSSETSLGKLKFLVGLSNREQCTHFIAGGDLSQDRIDSDEYKSRVIETLDEIEAEKRYALIGNHDILWRQYDTYRRRAIGIYLASKNLTLLDTQLLDIGVLGISAFNEKVINEVDALEQNDNVRIIFAHHYINHGSDRLVLNAKQLKGMFHNLRYIFTGHDHTEYPTVDMDGVTVVRIGGAMRISSSTENINRLPKAMILEWDSEAFVGIKMKEVLIPCLPASKVFNLDVKTVAKDVEHQLDSFMDNISASKSVGFDVEQVVLSKLQKLDDAELTEYIKGDLHNLLTA